MPSSILAMTDEPPRLDWRNVSTPNLRDFIGSDRGRDVAHLSATARKAGMALERVRYLPGHSGRYARQ